MAQETISAQFWKGLGNAVTDVQKTVEEATWGRPVTEQAQQPEISSEPERASFGSRTSNHEALKDWGYPKPQNSHDQGHEHGHKQDHERGMSR